MAKLLVIGSGGREHALSWRLKQSSNVTQIFCAPGNAGIAQDVTCVALDGHDAILEFCKKEAIALVIIGPEQPLVDGLADHLRTNGVPVFGPSAAAAKLEGSKGYMKNLCKKYNIPTAAYGYFHDKAEALAFLNTQSVPIVIKADGLAAGKGVIIAQTMEEASNAVEDMFAGQFGESGKAVVIEEFLEGPEVSFFALADSNTAIEFAYAQDHKRVGEGDTGPNTGGMGAFSPPLVMNDTLRTQIMREIVMPTIEGMKQEGAAFNGVLFAGIILTQQGPKLLEHNVRFGDPETQAMMMRYEGNLFELLLSCANGTLDVNTQITLNSQTAICVVMASNGYPAAYEKGSIIKNLDAAQSDAKVKIFHAGTTEKDGAITATGGRVLGVTALGDTMAQAQEKAYKAVDAIDWPQGFCRRDIGWRELKAKAS